MYEKLSFYPYLGNILGNKFALYRENNGVHLLPHEIVREMRIYTTDQSLRTVSHPDVHDVRADVLLADRRECMPQGVLRYPVTHDLLKDPVHTACHARLCN